MQLCIKKFFLLNPLSKQAFLSQDDIVSCSALKKKFKQSIQINVMIKSIIMIEFAFEWT